MWDSWHILDHWPQSEPSLLVTPMRKDLLFSWHITHLVLWSLKDSFVTFLLGANPMFSEHWKHRADWMPSWVLCHTVVHSFPFQCWLTWVRTKQSAVPESTTIVSSQESSLPLTIITLCSIGQEHKEKMGKELEASLRLEGQSSILNTNLPIVHRTLGDYPS